MKRKTKVLIFGLTVLLVLSSISAASAASVSKKIEAWFSGIKVIANGKTVASDLEPFIYNGSTYVPVRMVAEAVGKKVDWDGARNSVIITDGPADTASVQELTQLRALLSMKDAEITRLKQQLDEQEKKKNAADDLQTYLEDEYSEWKKIPFDFDVRGDESKLKLTIEFDGRKYSKQWDALSEKTIKSWLEDIYNYVYKKYPKASFSGSIDDTYNDKTLVDFSGSKGKLTTDFVSAIDFDLLEEDLGDYYGYNLSKKYGSSFGSLEAYFDVTGNTSKQKVDVTVEIDYRNYAAEWDAVEGTRAAENWLKAIANYILDECEDYTINGEVIDSRTGSLFGTFGTTSSGSIWVDWE